MPKPGPGDDLHICLDVTEVNMLAKLISFPIPGKETLVQNMLGAKCFV